jgi:hypothetical protein
MTPDLLSSLAAVILSLMASYLPGFSPWFDALTPNYKRLIMLALLVLIAAASYGLSCYGLGEELGIPLTCDAPGLIGLIRALLAAVIANQATFLISPRRHPAPALSPKKASTDRVK